ncbi:MAG: glycosyltransferase family 39 protein [Armatimonadota bacterium]
MRSGLWPILILMVLCASVYLACFNSLQVGQHVDDAYYVMLAQSLLSGQGYHQIAYAGQPLERKYPPLLPLLMVPFLWLSGGALWATKLPSLLSAIACIPVLYLLLRRFLTGPPLWLLVALVSLHPLIVGYAGMAMTEAPSLLLTWSVLLLALIAEEREGWRAWLPVALLLALGMLLRTDLIALVAAIAFLLLARRQWAAAAMVAALSLAPALIWHWYVGGSSDVSYVQELQVGWWDQSPLPLRLWHGLTGYLFDYIPQVTGLVFGSAVDQAAAARGLMPVVSGLKVALGLLVLAGFALSWRKLPPLITLFTVLRLGMLTAWPLVTRYLLPLLPFLFLYLAAPFSWRRTTSGFRREGPLPTRSVAIVFALLLLPALGRDALLVLRPPSREYPNVIAGGRLIAEHTPPGATVMSNWSARSFWLYSKRPAQELDVAQPTPEEILAQADRAQYLLWVDREEGPKLDKAKLLRSGRFYLLGRADRGKLTLWVLAPMS